MTKRQAFRVTELYKQLLETRLSPVEAGEKLKQLIQEFDLSADEALELSTEFSSKKGMAINDLLKFLDASGVDQMLKADAGLKVSVTKSDPDLNESLAWLYYLSEIANSPHIRPSSILQKIKSLNLLYFDINHPLTPQFMADTLIPYLQAVANLQQIIDQAQGNPAQLVRIKSIREGSALVSLEGASQAIELIMSILVPWRYKHTKAMAQLQEGEQQAKIEQIKTDILAKRLQTAKDRQTAEVSLAKQYAEVERLKLENEKLRLELDRSRVQLALEVLEKVNPDLSEIDKFRYTNQLLNTLDILTSSPLDPKLLTLDEA